MIKNKNEKIRVALPYIYEYYTLYSASKSKGERQIAAEIIRRTTIDLRANLEGLSTELTLKQALEYLNTLLDLNLKYRELK